MTLLQEKNISSAKILPLGLAISIFSYVFRLLFHKNIHRVTACTHKIHPFTGCQMILQKRIKLFFRQRI